MREQFNLNDSYKLIYLLGHERLQLFLYGIIVLIMPVFLSIVVILLGAELLGYSKLSESFERSYEFLTALLVYGGLIYFMTKRVQHVNVMRIYFNQETKKYVAVMMRGFVGLRKEEFTAAECVYRFDPILKTGKTDKLFTKLTQKHGNVYIGGKLRTVDFKSFSSYNSIEKIFGARIVDVLKNRKEL